MNDQNAATIGAVITETSQERILQRHELRSRQWSRSIDAAARATSRPPAATLVARATDARFAREVECLSEVVAAEVPNSSAKTAWVASLRSSASEGFPVTSATGLTTIVKPPKIESIEHVVHPNPVDQTHRSLANTLNNTLGSTHRIDQRPPSPETAQAAVIMSQPLPKETPALYGRPLLSAPRRRLLAGLPAAVAAGNGGEEAATVVNVAVNAGEPLIVVGENVGGLRNSTRVSYGVEDYNTFDQQQEAQQGLQGEQEQETDEETFEDEEINLEQMILDCVDGNSNLTTITPLLRIKAPSFALSKPTEPVSTTFTITNESDVAAAVQVDILVPHDSFAAKTPSHEELFTVVPAQAAILPGDCIEFHICGCPSGAPGITRRRITVSSINPVTPAWATAAPPPVDFDASSGAPSFMITVIRSAGGPAAPRGVQAAAARARAAAALLAAKELERELDEEAAQAAVERQIRYVQRRLQGEPEKLAPSIHIPVIDGDFTMVSDPEAALNALLSDDDTSELISSYKPSRMFAPNALDDSTTFISNDNFTTTLQSTFDSFNNSSVSIQDETNQLAAQDLSDMLDENTFNGRISSLCMKILPAVVDGITAASVAADLSDDSDDEVVSVPHALFSLHHGPYAVARLPRPEDHRTMLIGNSLSALLGDVIVADQRRRMAEKLGTTEATVATTLPMATPASWGMDLEELYAITDLIHDQDIATQAKQAVTTLITHATIPDKVLTTVESLEKSRASQVEHLKSDPTFINDVMYPPGARRPTGKVAAQPTPEQTAEVQQKAESTVRDNITRSIRVSVLANELNKAVRGLFPVTHQRAVNNALTLNDFDTLTGEARPLETTRTTSDMLQFLVGSQDEWTDREENRLDETDEDDLADGQDDESEVLSDESQQNDDTEVQHEERVRDKAYELARDHLYYLSDNTSPELFTHTATVLCARAGLVDSPVVQRRNSFVRGYPDWHRRVMTIFDAERASPIAGPLHNTLIGTEFFRNRPAVKVVKQAPAPTRSNDHSRRQQPPAAQPTEPEESVEHKFMVQEVRAALRAALARAEPFLRAAPHLPDVCSWVEVASTNINDAVGIYDEVDL